MWVICIINSWGYASYFMHFIHAYIASIIILASWRMHHSVSIMVIALCLTHHLDRAWNPPSSYCIIIANMHHNNASRSWLYTEHCTLNCFKHHLSLDCISINRHVLQSTSSKSFRSVSCAIFTCYPQSFVMNVADIYRPYVVILALWELDRLFLSSLVKLIRIRSIHALITLISSYSNDFYFSGVFVFLSHLMGDLLLFP
jgi:hypothetical protein